MIPEVGSGHKYVRIFKEEKYIKKNITSQKLLDQINVTCVVASSNTAGEG